LDGYIPLASNGYVLQCALAGIWVAILRYIDSNVGKTKSRQFVVFRDFERTGTTDKRQSRKIE